MFNICQPHYTRVEIGYAEQSLITAQWYRLQMGFHGFLPAPLLLILQVAPSAVKLKLLKAALVFSGDWLYAS